jgi:hypothetical protein
VAARFIGESLAITDELGIAPDKLREQGWGGWLLDELDDAVLSDDPARVFGWRASGRTRGGIRGFLATSSRWARNGQPTRLPAFG